MLACQLKSVIASNILGEIVNVLSWMNKNIPAYVEMRNGEMEGFFLHILLLEMMF